jgi:2,4-dienoyl-CoA reductase-like NADH-dependent reductase (Old Yellow Enzyme family)
MAADLFSPLQLRGVELPNRIAVSPMCQYSCDDRDGVATDWHLVHLGSRAVGGAGLVLTEATAVTPAGRISPEDLGIWTDEQAEALERIAAFVTEQGSVPGIQLAHAGRKASTRRLWEGGGPLSPDEGGWEVLAPSDVPYPFEEEGPALRAMTREDIAAVTDAFAAAAERASDAGFRVIEVHAAHGYLLHEFCSPVANSRSDDYGGSFENRVRFLREVSRAVRDVIPADDALLVRISATDWLPDRDSWDVEQSARLAGLLAEDGVDLVDVSSGGIHTDQQLPDPGPNYQVPLAERVREAGIPVGAVGKITAPEQADAIVRNGRADLALLAREHLRDPYFALHAAGELHAGDRLEPPAQYRRGF